MEPARDIVHRMVAALVKSLSSQRNSQQYCILVNNLGSVPNLELSLVAGLAVEECGKSGVPISAAIVGSLVTSLDMDGFSLTLFELSEDRRQALLAPTEAVGWVRPSLVPGSVRRVRGAAEPDTGSGSGQDTVLAAPASQCIAAAMETLIGAEAQLNQWDATVGDGDAGSSFAKGARSILRDCGQYPADPARLCLAIAGSASEQGGTSGAIVQIGLTAAARALQQETVPDTGAFPVALQAACEAIMTLGGAKPGSRTLVDALWPASQATSVLDAAAAARDGANATRTMAHAGAGRSSYIQTDLSGYACARVRRVRLVAKRASPAWKCPRDYFLNLLMRAPPPHLSSMYRTPDPGAEAVVIVLQALAANWPQL